jgi:hypothetical protein
VIGTFNSFEVQAKGGEQFELEITSNSNVGNVEFRQEEKVQECLNSMYKEGKRSIATYEITDYIGSTLNKSSFLYWAHRNKRRSRSNNIQGNAARREDDDDDGAH